MTGVDIPSADIIITQTNLVLALIITIGSVVGLGFQFIRWINKRITKSRDDEQEKRQQAVAEVKRYVDEKLRNSQNENNAKADLIIQKLEFIEKTMEYIMKDVDRIEDRLGLPKRERGGAAVKTR